MCHGEMNLLLVGDSFAVLGCLSRCNPPPLRTANHVGLVAPRHGSHILRYPSPAPDNLGTEPVVVG